MESNKKMDEQRGKETNKKPDPNIWRTNRWPPEGREGGEVADGDVPLSR